MNQGESARLLSAAIALALISTLTAKSIGQNSRSAKGPPIERIGPSASRCSFFEPLDSLD